MNSQPKCARNMAQRLAALKRDEEIDGLRVYLIKYNLFPRNRDPHTSPIRIEEIKELVKHWNLHRQRGFWRDHPEKEDLVKALLQHIKQESENRKRRQEAQEKYRKIGDRDDGNSDKLLPIHNNSSSNNGVPAAVSVFEESKQGDKFYQRGRYDEGMIYLSRMDKNPKAAAPADHSEKPSSAISTKSTASSSSAAAVVPATITEEDEQVLSNTNNTHHSSAPREIQLKCAEGIYNVSCHNGNEMIMLDEGVMNTIMNLTTKSDDSHVRLYLSAALINLVVSHDARIKMVEEGAIQVALELSHSPDLETKQNIATVLFRLSSDEQYHFRMVQEGVTLSLIQIMTAGEDDTKAICMKALINLAALPRSSVSDTIMSTLIRISKSEDGPTRHSCALGLLNLSIMATTRVTIVEEGAILALRILSADTNADIQRYISSILCNLAAVRANQELMVKNGALSVVNDLLDNNITEAVRNRQVATTLSYLCCNPKLQARIVTAGFIPKLLALLKDDDIDTKRHVTLSISNLTSHFDSRVTIVSEGAVKPLMECMVSSTDIMMKSDCVVALCNLMGHPDTYKDMVNAGVVPAFISLSDSPDVNIQRACALALLNLSFDESMQVKIVEQGVVPSLITLCALPSLELRMMCVTTLFNLSSQPENAQTLLYEGTVGVVVMVLSEGQHYKESQVVSIDQWEIQRQQCTAVLCNLSNFERGRVGMLEAGAIEALVQLSSALLNPPSIKDPVTKKAHKTPIERLNATRAFAAGTLCNLSSVASTSDAFFPTLLELASSHDVITTLRVAMAFSTISASSTGRHLLAIREEIAPGLIAMMRTGHHETQVNAAIALCNLARERGPRDHLWKQGTVPDFIVVALLRINSDATKEICARVLYNLLAHDDTRDEMIADGVLYALMKLAKLESLVVRELCIRAIYCISNDEERIPSLLEAEMVRVLGTLYSTDFSRELKRLVGGILGNMTLVTGNEAQLLHEGILKLVKSIVKVRDPETRAHSASILVNLSINSQVVPDMTKEGMIPVLISLSRSENKEIRRCAAGAICNISTVESVHSKLTDAGVIAAMVELIEKGNERHTTVLSVRTLANLCSSSSTRDHQVAIVKGHAVKALSTLMTVTEDVETSRLVADILVRLSFLPEVEEKLVNEGVVRTLVSMVLSSRDGDTNKCTGTSCHGNIVKALRNLSRNSACHTTMLNDGVVEALVIMAGQDTKTLTQAHSASFRNKRGSNQPNVSSIPITYNMEEDFSLHCSITLRNLSTSPEDGNRAKVSSQSGAIRTLLALSLCPNTQAKENVCVVLYNLSCYKRSRGQIIALNGVKTLIRLCQANPSGTAIHNVSAMALHSLSTHEGNIMAPGLVSSLSTLGDLSSSTIDSMKDLASSVVPEELRPPAVPEKPLGGIENPTQQLSAPSASQWYGTDLEAPAMPAFSTSDVQGGPGESKATPPRQCIMDAVQGEFKIMDDDIVSKHLIFTREAVKKQPSTTSSSSIAEEAEKQMADSSSLPVLSRPPETTTEESHPSSSSPRPKSSASQVRIDAKIESSKKQVSPNKKKMIARELAPL